MESKAIVIVLLALLVCACGPDVVIEQAGQRNIGGQEVQVEEIQFRCGEFKLVGDLLIPAGGDRHPAVIMVHGDGPVTRDGYSTTLQPAREILLRNGYAVFSWDKPGSGESTGEFNRKGEWDVLTKRAEILAAGVQVLAEHPAIDPARIGLWGISQAGWVMPKALALSDRVAFMIVVSGGAEASPEQMAYLFGQKVACGGGTADQAALVEEYWAQTRNATSYDEYREAMEILTEIPRFEQYLGGTLEITEEDNWKPRNRDTDTFFDPTEVLEHTTIPVLAFFGELDRNIDPVQGAEAYTAALQKAGNQDYHVVFIPGVAHTLVPVETGCLNESWGSKLAPEYLETLEQWLQHLSESNATTQQREQVSRFGEYEGYSEPRYDGHALTSQYVEMRDGTLIAVDIYRPAQNGTWEPLSRDHEAFFDPMDVIEHTKIPLLAIFGELDVSIDPVQGVEACLDACQRAGNGDCQIETLSGRGHVFTHSPTYLDILEAWIQLLPQ